jgi:ankyrin repeat protein
MGGKNRRRRWLIGLGVIVCLAGVVTWSVLRSVHQAEVNDALLQALRSEDEAAALAAIEAGADPNAYYVEGRPKETLLQTMRRLLLPKPTLTRDRLPALFMATLNDQPAVVRLLLRKGANPRARGWPGRWLGNGEGITAVHAACAGDVPPNAEIIKMLVAAGAPVDAPDPHGYTPLHYACMTDDVEIFKILTAAGADVNGKDPDGETPLYRACLVDCDVEIIEVLIAAGAQVNATDVNGQTPLHYACDGGDTANVRVLLAHGADVNARDTIGERPVDCARTSRAGTEIIQMLAKARPEN